MKKLPLSLFQISIFISCIICFINCNNDDIGLGGNDAPENKFKNGEWEKIDTHYYAKISFLENEFSFYEKSDHPIAIYENTYKGEYSLFYDIDNEGIKTEILKLVSDEILMSGNLRYLFNINGHHSESVWFIAVNNSNFPLGGIYSKVHLPELLP